MDFTQFKRACEELGIDVIVANSPQAKGRIEKFWGFVQDRIIPEMRLANITKKSEATIYFNNYMKMNWKDKYSVRSTNVLPYYKPLPEFIDLNEVFCFKYSRVVANDQTIKWKTKTYLIKNAGTNLKGRFVEVREYRRDGISVHFNGRDLLIVKVLWKKDRYEKEKNDDLIQGRVKVA